MAAQPTKEYHVSMSEAGEKRLAGSDGIAPSSTSDDLSEDERMIIDKQLAAPNEKIGFFALFRYAKSKDIFIMAVGIIASIVAGACLPLMTVSSHPRS
jgi:ATP-binding cassette subfamily B (MDR/TAP) protein 1